MKETMYHIKKYIIDFVIDLKSNWRGLVLLILASIGLTTVLLYAMGGYLSSNIALGIASLVVSFV